MIRDLLTTAVLAFASAIAAADTITVCLDGSCEYSDIQQAINAASDGDVIEIAAGIYYPAATIDTIGKAVTLRGVPGKGKDDAPTSIIDGQDSIRVLICQNEETALTVFENLLITGGLAEGDSPDNRGGGMFNQESSPTLTNCTFAGNSAAHSGGGMSNMFSSSPTLSNCTFTGNSASYGGGMYNYQSSSPTLENCTFLDNSAYEGGGMNNFQSSPTLINCTFTGNSASDWGGGMYNYYDSSPTLTNCTFTDNSSHYGGGMFNYSGSSPTLTDCTFTSNSAGDGGGMLNYESSPTLTDCTFTGNSADDNGGGMYNYYYSSPTLTGGDFIGNIATTHGGALYGEEYASVSLVECQFASNSDLESYALFNLLPATATLTDCVFDRCCAIFPITSAVDLGGNYTLYICGGCEGDVTCDGTVDAADLGRLLAAWGPSTGRFDLNADGEVSGADLGFLFSTWGPCP